MLSHLISQYGCPLYLYDEQTIQTQTQLLTNTLPDFTILYSLKTNPHPAICKVMHANGLGADVASSAEVDKALAAGFAPDTIYYSAPGKSDDELRSCLDKAIIVADSYGELERINALAKGQNRIVHVGLRINPNISFAAGEYSQLVSGVASKFGVDEESLEPHTNFFKQLANIRIVGIHVYLRSQMLRHTTHIACCQHVFALAQFCTRAFGWNLSFINFGGGFGVAYGATQSPIDLASLQLEMKGVVASWEQQGLQGVKILLETGRFLVAEAGTFVSRIVDVKHSRGKTFAIVPGGLTGFLRPSIMNLLTSLPFAVEGPFEPLFSNGNAHTVCLPERSDPANCVVTVSGNLCTTLDVIARDVLLPEPKVGDIITVSHAGAYAATLSPFAFSSHPRPVELFKNIQGAIRAISL